MQVRWLLAVALAAGLPACAAARSEVAVAPVATRPPTSASLPTSAAAATTSPPVTTAPLPTASTAASSTSGPSTTRTSAGPLGTAAAATGSWPLTGLPADPADPRYRRPALVVKIDNAPQARPQSGLNAADVVIEEIVESATRYLAVFHSSDADTVGPVRSARTSDLAILGGLGRPLLAWSGGNPAVRTAVRAADLVDVGFEARPDAGYVRRRDRSAPGNLYTAPAALRAVGSALGAGDRPPPALFRFGPAAPRGGVPMSAAAWTMEGVRLRWDWEQERFALAPAGRPRVDAEGGERLTADNVVILEVAYRPSPADARSPEAQTVGTGPATVLAAGMVFSGTWSRARADAPFVLSGADGSPMLLAPGRTWVSLVRPGTALEVG